MNFELRAALWSINVGFKKFFFEIRDELYFYCELLTRQKYHVIGSLEGFVLLADTLAYFFLYIGVEKSGI
jgi:hypothetical protein